MSPINRFPYHHDQGTNATRRRLKMAIPVGWHGNVLGWSMRYPLFVDAGATDCFPLGGKQFFRKRLFSPVDVGRGPSNNWLGHSAGVQATQGFFGFSAFAWRLRPTLLGHLRAWTRSSSSIDCFGQLADPGKHSDQSWRSRHGIRPSAKLPALP